MVPDWYTARSPWHDDAWRADVLGWVGEALGRAGLVANGDVEPRLRPWSVTARVPTDQGPVWLKCNPPASAFEPGLVVALGRWAAGRVLTPVAVDVTRAWSLLPDGGTTLRVVLDADPDLTHWEDALGAYAELQRQLTAHTADMIALGVPDLSPEHLPAQLDGPVADLLPDEVRRFRPTVAAWCEELTAVGVPPSLDHSDLHDANVLVRGSGATAFYDWGDASVGHPFTSLLVTMRVVRERYGLAPDAPELARLRDAYLEPWSGYGSAADLRRAVWLALRLAPISRAASWCRIFPSVAPTAERPMHDMARAWLSRLVEQDVI